MPTIDTPANFKVIRSEDRESAVFAWNAPAPLVIPLTFAITPGEYIPGQTMTAPDSGLFPPFSDTQMHMYNYSGAFTGTSAGTYKITVISTGTDGGTGYTNQALLRISKDGVNIGIDILVNTNQVFNIADGLSGKITGPVDHVLNIKLVDGMFWTKEVTVATAETVPLVSYTIRQSERHNGLGFSEVAVIGHNNYNPRQYAVIDNLDPDQFYSFDMYAKDEQGNVSALTPITTDF
jgi:hypothetical protein